MKERGYSELVLHTDEVAAALFRPSKFADMFSPAELARGGRRTVWGNNLFLVKKMYQISAVIFLIVCGLAAVDYFLDPGFDPLILALLFLLFLLFPPIWVFACHLFSPLPKWDSLQWAIVDGRWEEALHRAKRIPLVPKHTLAFFRARALIGLGRAEEGLREFDTFADDKRLPKWLYWSQRAELLERAGRDDEAVVNGDEALRLAPSNPVPLLGLAELLVRFRHDTVRSRELLARAREHPKSEPTRFAYSMVEGLIALREQKPAARELFERAIEELAPFRNAPLTKEPELTIRAYLAIALARGHERDAAEEQFHLAEQYLRAHGRGDLIREYETAIAKA
jgi:tetratricopeptide (TPR) repeat protein